MLQPKAESLAPLRRVTGPCRQPVRAAGMVVTVAAELLECGHALPPAQDIYGIRHPERRRCWKCAKGRPADEVE